MVKVTDGMELKIDMERGGSVRALNLKAESSEFGEGVDAGPLYNDYEVASGCVLALYFREEGKPLLNETHIAYFLFETILYLCNSVELGCM